MLQVTNLVYDCLSLNETIDIYDYIDNNWFVMWHPQQTCGTLFGILRTHLSAGFAGLWLPPLSARFIFSASQTDSWAVSLYWVNIFPQIP